jgi:DNA mismatch repair protein MutL
MNDIIHLLPDSVANQIAAGEVIQRPASVVKELVENAIDADAKNIQVIIIDAGRTTIQVIDDGKGMSETDARLSFERHATSKITNAADLFALHTMGFRGEALASIAAVAHITLKTRMESDEIGTQLSISGSHLEKQEPVACPKGSNFIINDLFYNVPARRKFLKSNTTEMNNIISEFERIVLVHPDVAFSLRSNGTELYHLPVESFMQRIVAVFGKKMDGQLLSLDVETSLIHISGYIGRPMSSVKHNAKQFLFVNGRYMRHPYFHKAVMEGYNHLIPADEQVNYFIYFEVDPANIDVNIHPTKTEIKFENESAIWQILLAAVKESLGKFNEMPTIDFDTEGMPDIPVFDRGQAKPSEMPDVHINKNYNPFERPGGYSRKSDWEALYQGTKKTTQDVDLDNVRPASTPPAPSLYEESAAGDGQQVDMLQIKGRFILTSVPSGLMMIDQRRAHIRVLYEQYMLQLKEKTGVSQRVLFPDVIQFTPSEQEVLKEMMEELTDVGFDLADLGNGSFSINAVPADAQGMKLSELLHNMIQTNIERDKDIKEEIRHNIALSLATSAAIVYGQVLSQIEMSRLVNDLFVSSNPNYTPDGHIILTIYKEEEIEKRF